MCAVDQNHGLTVLYKHFRFGIGLEGFKSKMKIYEENYYYHFTDKEVIGEKNGVTRPKITEDNLLQRPGLSTDLLALRTLTCLALAYYLYYCKGKINICKHIHRDDETLAEEFRLSKDL